MSLKSDQLEILLGVFIAMFLNIIQSYVHSIYNSALTVIFTPVLQNQEK